MSKKKCIGLGVIAAATPIETNLSLSITGADDWIEGSSNQYTIALDLTGYIGSPDTVVTATLPAGITYISSSDSGSESSGVVTWTLGTLMADKNLTLTITSTTPAVGYEINVAVTSSINNLGTATDTKTIEVEETPLNDIELRVSFADFAQGGTITDVSMVSLTVGGTNVLPLFNFSWETINDQTIKIGGLDGSVASGNLFISLIVTSTTTGPFPYFNGNIGPFSYVKAEPTTIPTEENFG